MSPNLLFVEISATKTLTTRPFGVNLITINPQPPEPIDVCANPGVGHVVLAGGLPTTAAVSRIKRGGAHVFCFAPALAFARKLVRMGVDAIVIEGSEAGGHIGPVSTGVLAQEILPHLADVPVFVAGGVGGGGGGGSFFSRGGAGGPLGAPPVCVRVSLAHPPIKRALSRA